MTSKSNALKICAKGSRKSGNDFIKETKYLSHLVDCIEIDFNYPHDRNFKKEIDFLKKLKRDEKISYTVHAQYLSGGLNDFNDKIRQETANQIYKSIDIAAGLKAKIVTLHPALEPYGLKIAGRYELEIDAYKKIAAYAAKRKIFIGLENEAKTCFWFPDRACEFDLLFKTINLVNNKYFGMTLDIGHANVSGQDYISAIKKFHEKIYHIHAHDNSGKPENNLEKYNRPDPHLAPGKGLINWKKVAAAIESIGYKGYFELECEMHEMKKAIEYIKSL